MGFGAQVQGPDERRAGEVLKDVQTEDLLKFGLIPEFIGRLPVLATLEDLDIPALIKILTEPKNALTKQYARLFDIEGVKLTFQEDALTEISKKAIDRNTGARGLRSILEVILLDTMFELPGMEGVEEVVVKAENVINNTPPVLVYSDKKKTKDKDKKKKDEEEAAAAS
jgi:ATP-dependent Clp protease ATP-binding subunit ClpX